MTTLSDLEIGAGGRVVRIEGTGAFAQRLMAMGFMPDVPLKVVQVAPFGDPITVELNGWRVSLRRADAASVAVRTD